MKAHVRPFGSLCVLSLGLVLSAATACSTTPSRPTSDHDISKAQVQKGPAILYVRADPGHIELDREFKTPRPVDILADIKDYDSRVDKVLLRFNGIPLEIQMEMAGGSTWRARLTQRQLELLAVSGRTVQYEALVVARDEKGRTGTSQAPVSFAIQTPELAGAGGVGRDENTSSAMESSQQAGSAADPPAAPAPPH